jgi:ferredoxin
MMQSLLPALRGWGVDENDIHFEAFGPLAARPAGTATNEPPAAPAVALDIRLDRSGRTLVWNGQDANLLDFAERHGVAVEAGCRTGSCGTCETRLLSGTVHYAEQPDHDIAPGHCLLCVGTPQSALVLDA